MIRAAQMAARDLAWPAITAALAGAGNATRIWGLPRLTDPTTRSR